MRIIAGDYHPSFQQIARLDQNTGELSGRRLAHPAEAEAFYRGLQGSVLVGMEAIGNALRFERLSVESGHELWVGDAACLRAAAVRRQKTDARDAAHLLQLCCRTVFRGFGCPRTPAAGGSGWGAQDCPAGSMLGSPSHSLAEVLAPMRGVRPPPVSEWGVADTIMVAIWVIA